MNTQNAMKEMLRRVRGSAGLTWALAWAAVGGGVMEGFLDPRGELVDMWPQTLAIAGFFGGAIFSELFWLAEGRRGYGEVPLARVAAWGALSGLGLSVFLLATGAPNTLIGPAALVCAVSAVGSALWARLSARRRVGTAAEA